jgi:flavin-dependent dehydrogenase
MTARRFDAVVVGAGTAGGNAAYQLARRGLSVALLERRVATLGGAQWHNGVLAWQFERAGLSPPAAPERASSGTTFHIVGPDGTHGVTLAQGPVMRADMALLGQRLRSLACDAGAVLVDEVERLEVEHRGDRLVAVEVRSADAGDAAPRRFEADLFVDASGRGGALRRRSQVLDRWCPPVQGAELCAAGDYAVRIDDPDGARRFLDRHGAAPGEHVNRLGLDGGWSTRSITVSEDLSEASVLVGCVADGRNATVPEMMAALRRDEPWLGATLSGGTGVIPLRRPYARLTAPGLALVGDAACQVFPVHGSGIGLGLIAGGMLADAVEDARDPGSPLTLWRYQAAFHREFGPDLVAFDGVRRMSTALGSDGVRRMVAGGLFAEGMTRASLDQRWAAPSAAEALAMARRLARRPSLAALMVPALARAQAARVVARRSPREPDETALARWDRRIDRALGSMPT